jgi:hypothetical protein
MMSVGGPVGGSVELARVLGPRAKESPERFSRLALDFNSDIPVVAMTEVIRNVAGRVPSDVFADLCEHAASVYDERVGREMCLAIAGAGPADRRLIALLDKYSQAHDPDHDQALSAGLGAPLYGGDLYSAGLNSTRGACAVAAAEIAAGSPELVDLLMPIGVRLAADPTLSVRTQAAHLVMALAQHHPEAALDLASTLFECDDAVFDAPSTEELLLQVLTQDPERFTSVFQRVLAGSPQIAQRGGRIWAFAEHRGVLRQPVPADVNELSADARSGAAEVLSANVEDSADQLGILFDDAEANVRANAARSMRRLPDPIPPQVAQLVDKFIESAAFVDHMDDLIDGLVGMRSNLPAATLKACQRVVEISTTELADMTKARAATGHQLIRIVLRLYRQGDDETRRGCLDIIDRPDFRSS